MLRVIAPGVLLAVAVLLGGCREEDFVRDYVVARQPQPGTVWFFKLIGPAEAVTSQAEQFETFLKSVRFDDATGVPSWDLPEGWTEEGAANPVRFRTVKIPSTPPLEIAVSHVSGRVPLTSNEVERHLPLLKQQVGIDPDEEDEGASADDEAVAAFQAGTYEARLVDLEGTTTRFGKTRLISGMIGVPVEMRMATPESQGPVFPFAYEQPEGWTDAPQTQFSVVSLSAPVGDEAASVTVTPSMGGLTANINRWRRQAGLEEFATPSDLAASVERIPTAGLEVRYHESIGESRGILGGIIGQGDEMWFVKLDGSPDAARALREQFREFLASFRPISNE